jgi:hypothetical protein
VFSVLVATFLEMPKRYFQHQIDMTEQMQASIIPAPKTLIVDKEREFLRGFFFR